MIGFCVYQCLYPAIRTCLSVSIFSNTRMSVSNMSFSVYIEQYARVCQCLYQAIRMCLSVSISSNTHVSVSVYIEQYARVCQCLYRAIRTCLPVSISSNTHVCVGLRVPGQGPVVEDEGGGAEGGAGHVVAGPRHQRGRGAEGGRHGGHCRQ